VSVDLVPHWQIGDVVLTSYPFGVDADSTVDVGEPEMIVETVPSQMADGDTERVLRHGNRTYRLEFYIEGPTLGALAESEALLRAQLRRPLIPLLHDPGDGLSPSSVYEVQTAQLTPQRRDDHEAHLVRKFTLTLTCAPWARSADAVTVDALESGTNDTPVDACTSTTGWSGSRSGPGSASLALWGGFVGVVDLDSAVTSPEVWTLVRTGAVDFTSTPYLKVEARTVSPVANDVRAYVDGTELPLLAVRALPGTDGWSEFTFMATGVASSLAFVHTSAAGEDWQGLVVRSVRRTDINPGETVRQLTRIVEVGGTERTPASIHVQSADGTSSLGVAIIHSSPEDRSGYSPPLQRWRTVGQTRTADATAFSGNYESINTSSWIAEVPTSALPEGGYVLMARLRAQTAATVTVTWSTSTIFPDAAAQEGFTVGTVQHTFDTGNVWNLVKMDALTLPSVRTKAGKVQIALQVAAASPVVTLDEAWLFREDDDCALTIVETTRPHLWLDSPDLESPVPRVWVGDGSATKVHPGTGLQGMGAHVLSPEGTAVFTAALTDNPATDATFFRRWHSNAAS
jgi:hypothetical protein